MKIYLALPPGARNTLADTTELTLFPGGYAGMQHVDNGRTVLCIAIRRAAFQRLWRHLVQPARARSSAAAPDSPRCWTMPETCCRGRWRSPASPTATRPAPDVLFRLGDQAAVIPSLTGDGIAMALHSGEQAAAGLAEPAARLAIISAPSPGR